MRIVFSSARGARRHVHRNRRAPPPKSTAAAEIAAATEIAAAAKIAPAAECHGHHNRRRPDVHRRRDRGVGMDGAGAKLRRVARSVETVAARRGAQHPAGARIGVEPVDAPVRRHPFEMIMFRAARAGGGTVGVIELAGMGAADFGQDAVQRLHARGAICQDPPWASAGPERPMAKAATRRTKPRRMAVF